MVKKCGVLCKCHFKVPFGLESGEVVTLLVERGFVITPVVGATGVRLILTVWHGAIKVADTLGECGAGTCLVALKGKTDATNLAKNTTPLDYKHQDYLS